MIDPRPQFCPACRRPVEVVDLPSLRIRGVCVRCSCEPTTAPTVPVLRVGVGAPPAPPSTEVTSASQHLRPSADSTPVPVLRVPEHA